MTLKDKLKENDIDTVKEKDLVDKIKNELNEKGENGAKITNKLTLEGEKIVDSIIMNYKNSTHKSTVNRPKTITRNNLNDKPGTNENTNKNSEKDKKDPEKNEKTNASQSTSGDFDDNHRKLTRSGNIGVTTSQQMLQSEIELRQWNFYNMIMNDIDEIMCLSFRGV